MLHGALDHYAEVYARLIAVMGTIQELIAKGKIESQDPDTPGFEIDLISGSVYTLLDDMAITICDLQVMMKQEAGQELDWSHLEE